MRGFTSKEKRVHKQYRALTKFLKRTSLMIGSDSVQSKADRDFNIYMLEKRREKKNF